MHAHIEELTPEEIALMSKRALLRSTLRGEAKAANDGKAYCTFCRCELSQGKTRLSHLIPLSMGGESTAHNAVIACPSCCEAKSGQSLDQWRERLTSQLEGVQTQIERLAQKAEKPAA